MEWEIMMNSFTLSQLLGFALEKRGLKIAVAESCTGGGLSNEITAVPGSSKWFDRGFITYSDASKVEILGVHLHTLEEYGAVSQQTAYEMAINAIDRSQADIAVSITGIAGPTGGSQEKPVGLVWFGIAKRNGTCQTRKALLTSGRKYIRDCAIEFIFHWLLEDLGIPVEKPHFGHSHEIL